MPDLTKEQIKKYSRINRQNKFKIISVINLLKMVNEEFNLYSDQRKSDLNSGYMKKGSFYIPLKFGRRDLFEDHYTYTYIANVITLLEHLNKTDSVIARWLLSRTIIETIYRYAKVSLSIDLADKKIKRFRALMVLDFHLHLANITKKKRWVDEYFDVLISDKRRTDIFKPKDFNNFPNAANTLFSDNTDELRRSRVKHLINLASSYFIEQPNGHKEVYDNVSRLVHGNPYQTTIARKLEGQWRERFLIYGLIIKSCDDLLKAIVEVSGLKDKRLMSKLKSKSAELEKFYLEVLKPGWEEVAKIELDL